ncbi:translocase of inner mitochondrial membrane 17-like protein B [Sesbania bispinosa]|nr:translocase of inner mitochondrial membrane 17-like protein B [Sesbania bispinosa]
MNPSRAFLYSCARKLSPSWKPSLKLKEAPPVRPPLFGSTFIHLPYKGHHQGSRLPLFGSTRNHKLRIAI